MIILPVLDWNGFLNKDEIIGRGSSQSFHLPGKKYTERERERERMRERRQFREKEEYEVFQRTTTKKSILHLKTKTRAVLKSK